MSTSESILSLGAVWTCTETARLNRLSLVMHCTDVLADNKYVPRYSSTLSAQSDQNGMLCSLSFTDRSHSLYSGCSVLQSMEGSTQGQASSHLSFLKTVFCPQAVVDFSVYVVDLQKWDAESPYVNVRTSVVLASHGQCS